MQDADGGVVADAGLVDHVANRTDAAVTRKAVDVALHHQELPTFGAAGVIDSGARGGTIRYRSSPLLENLLAAALAEMRD